MSYQEFLNHWTKTRNNDPMFQYNFNTIVLFHDIRTGMYQSVIYLDDGGRRNGKRYPSLDIAFEDIYEQIQTYL